MWMAVDGCAIPDKGAAGGAVTATVAMALPRGLAVSVARYTV